MSTSAPQQRGVVPIIDLVSDDEDSDDGNEEDQLPSRRGLAMDTDSDTSSVEYQTPPMRSKTPSSITVRQPIPNAGTQNHDRNLGGSIIVIDDEEIFIPDDDEVEETGANITVGEDLARDREIALALDRSQVVTADECLQRVLEIFPDISHDYVHNLYQEFDTAGDYETLPGSARLDNIIEQLVSNPSYPKQEKGRKRKREDTIEGDLDKQWDRDDRFLPGYLKGSMQAMLKADFPDIPVQYINDTLAAHRTLFRAFIALAKAKDSSDAGVRQYGKGRPSLKQHLADANVIAANCGYPPLVDELNAARKRAQTMRLERAAEEAKKLAEQENLRQAIDAGQTAECSACFDDLPMNRQIHCDGLVAHFTCFECAETYIKSEIGESRCRVLCPAGCGVGFSQHQLNLLSDKQSLEKLSQLQQEKDIRDAGLDDLEECPFCDYKAILPPIEEDFEFRCANPDCERVSCRRCKAVSHIPMSCEQHAKDNKVNSRHRIEEAMTAALVRSCNKCKKQFIKDHGCNKMSCPSCGNLQCYVCSATVKDYNHFNQNHPGRPSTASKSNACPLYDNVEERHEREVNEAEAKTRAQVIQENPDVSAEDLEIKVSEAVKNATTERIRRGENGGLQRAVGAGDLAAFAGPPGMPGGFGVFGLGDLDRDADFDRIFPAGRRPWRHRARDFNPQQNADLLANLEQLRNEVIEVRRRYPPGPPPQPVQPAPQPGMRHIFVPGGQPAQQAQPPAAPVVQHQQPVQGAQYRPAPGQIPPPLHAPDRRFLDAFGLRVDDARHAPPFWLPQPNEPEPQHRAYGINNYLGAGVWPWANEHEALQGHQGFNPGIRDQRQNFQNLEMLRQQATATRHEGRQMLQQYEQARQLAQRLQQENAPGRQRQDLQG